MPRVNNAPGDNKTATLPLHDGFTGRGLKICMYADSEEPSGMGQHMLTLASELRHDHQITFVCHSHTRLHERACLLGFPTYSIPDDIEGIVALIEELRPDIFHAHAGIGWECHPGVYAAKRAGVPCVLRTEHLPFLIDKEWQHQEYLEGAAHADRIICVSWESMRSFERAGVSSDKLRCVHNGIPAMRVVTDRGAVVTSLGLPDNARIVATVGRLTEQKGHTYLLSAVPEVLRRQPNAYFVIVGEGPLEGELRQQAHDLGIAERVIFGGSRNDVPRIIAACDLFVLPSLFEGLPLVALEAMQLGRPVVGTRVSGISEAVAAGLTGTLVEPRDPGALTAAIVEVLSNAALAQRYGQAGRERARGYFSAARMAQETLATYRALLPQPERSPAAVFAASESHQSY